MHLLWPWKTPGGAGKRCGALLEREMSGILCLACCHLDPILDKAKNSGWVELHLRKLKHFLLTPFNGSNGL